MPDAGKLWKRFTDCMEKALSNVFDKYKGKCDTDYIII